MPGERLSIIDCETTGLGRNDRVIEVAVVTVDQSSGEVVGEFDTLINPERDVGPTQLHGITASMVGMAPSFVEVSQALAARLHGSTIVAHNLKFDVRMLNQEFERIPVSVNWGRGICTLQATGMKLSHAARAFGVQLKSHHRALSDARVVAEIVKQIDWSQGSDQCLFDEIQLIDSCRTLRREAFGECLVMPLRRWLRSACTPCCTGVCVEYFDLLDHVLSDLSISDQEQVALRDQRERLGLSPKQIDSMHMAYFESLKRAALSDGTVCSDERAVLVSVAGALGLSNCEIPLINEPASNIATMLEPGTRVCFTGCAMDSEGIPISREQLELVTAARGYQPVANVTKRGCDVLVAADRSSQSGKAKRARQYGIPIVALGEYLDLIGAV